MIDSIALIRQALYKRMKQLGYSFDLFAAKIKSNVKLVRNYTDYHAASTMTMEGLFRFCGHLKLVMVIETADSTERIHRVETFSKLVEQWRDKYFLDTNDLALHIASDEPRKLYFKVYNLLNNNTGSVDTLVEIANGLTWKISFVSTRDSLDYNSNSSC